MRKPCLNCGRPSPDSYCPACNSARQRVRDDERGSRQARGYGVDHERKRAEVKPLVESGQAVCWRCGKAIGPRARWDLGHDDADRRLYRGPEHVKCNRGRRPAAGSLDGRS